MRAQEALVAAGYNVGEPDGKAGKATIAAVKKFQGDRHLPVTGKLDAITLAALGVGTSNDPAATDKADLILADAVYALAHTIDVETQKPAFLAATNRGPGIDQLADMFVPVYLWRASTFMRQTETDTPDATQGRLNALCGAFERLRPMLAAAWRNVK